MGIKVKTRHNEPVEKALKRLKRTLQKEGQQRELMRHRYHETESVRRRRQRHKNARKVRAMAQQAGRR
jgi:ribosomal protein S21